MRMWLPNQSTHSRGRISIQFWRACHRVIRLSDRLIKSTAPSPVQEFCLTFLNLPISLGSIQKLLEYTSNGIRCVDRWGAYTKYHNGIIQFCWAHLKRDVFGILKTGRTLNSTDGILFAKTMERLRSRMMALWYDFKDGNISRLQLIEKSEPIIELIKTCFSKYEHCQERYVRTLSKKLLKHVDKLFVFIYHEGVEPTNNISERGIRPAAQWRKLCFGNRSDNGAMLTARLLTVVRTCWLQQRNPLEFLVTAIKAYRDGDNSPSLLF